MVINHFGLSGGKDSTALLGWALHESSYPRESLRFSFCDTENEYEEVYEQIRKLDAIVIAAGCPPIRWLRANNPDWSWTRHPLFLALAIWKGRFPSAKARFCTQELKIKPTISYLEELWLDGHEVVAHSGVRGSESLERSLMSEWGRWFHYKTVPKRFRTRLIATRKGKPMMVATIDDVARWSETGKGAKLASPEAVSRWLQIPDGGIQTALGFMFEEEDFNADDAALPCQSGHCE